MSADHKSSAVAPLIGIVMGSDSDWPTMQAAAVMLKEFGVAFEARVVSAHRTPDLLFEYAETAGDRGLQAIIAGAGGAAHLPGMLAAKTIVPVLSYGPNYSRAAIESLADMSRCVRDDYSTLAYDYLLSAERAARRNGIDIPELNA